MVRCGELTSWASYLTWVNAHRSELVNYGKQGQSATYMAHDNPNRVKVNAQPDAPATELAVGSVFRVASVQLRGGHVELELMAESGETIRVQMLPDGS